MNNYLLQLINTNMNHLKATMSSGKFRAIAIKQLLCAIGPLSTETVKQVLRFLEAPDDLTEDTLRQALSRLRSDNDFHFEKKENSEYVMLNDPILVAKKVFETDDKNITCINSNQSTNLVASTCANDPLLIYNSYSVLSNLNVANCINYDSMSTIQFYDYTEEYDTSLCEIHVGENGEYHFYSIVTQTVDTCDKLITNTAKRFIDTSGVCYPYRSIDLLFVPDVRHCTVNTNDLKTEKNFIHGLIHQTIEKGKGIILLLAKAFENEYPTISAFKQHILNLTSSLSDKCCLESEAWFFTLNLLDLYDDTRTADIDLLLNSFYSLAKISSLDLLTKKIDKEVSKQKELLYEFFETKYSPLEDSFIKEPGVSTGQMIVFESPKTLLKNVAYLHSRDLTFDIFPNLFKNLGLDYWSYPTICAAWPPRTLPISNGHETDPFRTLHLRNAMNLNGTIVAIENISTDIGGLLRTSYYLNRRMGEINDVLLIALISDDYILADGQHLFTSKALYRKPLSGHERETLSAGFRNVLQFLFDAKRTIKGSYKYLPIYKTDIIFLTYSQFEEAKHSRVYPWLYDYEREEFILRGH